MARITRAMLVAVAFGTMVAVSGCFFVDGHFAMEPDGTVNSRLETGVLQSMAEQADIGAELDEGLAADRWTREEPFDRDQWRVTALVGRAGPGDSLFKEDAEPQPRFEMTRHLLSTTYSFTMAMPEHAVQQEPAEQPAPPEGAEAEAEVQVEGMEGLGEAFGEMMTMMMSAGDSGLRFSVELPGAIVETNGTLTAPGIAAWRIELTGEPPEELHARSSLPNWAEIGRLGAALTERGRWDLAPALIAAVQRGVVPDPMTADPGAAEFNVLMYVQALEIMLALDDAVGPRIADAVMARLGLGGDPAPAMVEAIAVRLEGIDLAAEVDQEVTEQLLRVLGGG